MHTDNPTQSLPSYTEILQSINTGNNSALIRYLEQGGDPNEGDNWGAGALLEAAINNGNISAVRLLIKNGADIYTHEYSKENAFLNACDKGYIDIVESLFEHSGPDVVMRRNRSGKSPLHRAFNIEVLDFLLSKGAEVNGTDSGGCSALHYFAIRNIPQMCQRVLDAGIDTTLKDNEGREALDYAHPSTASWGVISSHLEKEVLIRATDCLPDQSRRLPRL